MSANCAFLVQKKRLLIFAPYFSPAIRAGGPVKSLSYLASKLSEQYDVFIVTRGFDLGNRNELFDVRFEVWINNGEFSTLYIKDNFYNFKSIIKSVSPDLIYFNSFFDFKLSILPLYSSLLFARNASVILAPRGELTLGALRFKAFRKKTYIWFFNLLNSFFSQIMIHVTSQDELRETSRVLSNSFRFFVAPNLSECDVKGDDFFRNRIRTFEDTSSVDSQSGSLRIVFISRIVEKKNLEFALVLLRSVSIPIKFDIYGPIEDPVYWKKCSNLIDKLPSNINVRHMGHLNPSEVSRTFFRYDLFFFPTRSENYGHVIAEALLSGTLVLTSDQTPWYELERLGLGSSIPLEHHEKFRDYILQLYSNIDIARNTREDRLQVALDYIRKFSSVAYTEKLFQKMLEARS